MARAPKKSRMPKQCLLAPQQPYNFRKDLSFFWLRVERHHLAWCDGTGFA